MSLKNLINKIGKAPKILIDYWGSQNKIGYACFDFEDTLLWNKKGIFLNYLFLVLLQKWNLIVKTYFILNQIKKIFLNQKALFHLGLKIDDHH